jgi:hypothetical protein
VARVQVGLHFSGNKVKDGGSTTTTIMRIMRMAHQEKLPKDSFQVKGSWRLIYFTLLSAPTPFYLELVLFNFFLINPSHDSLD